MLLGISETPEPELVNLLKGAQESIPNLGGRYENPIWRTGPLGGTQAGGIDSWADQ